MDVIVAGWSESAGPDLYLLRTMANTPTPAWRVIDTGGVLLTPSSDAIFAEVNEPCANSDIGILSLEEIMG
jgi:hypothetical protein